MKIIGMLPTYNDEDIIEEVVQHLISQEIPLVVLDNGSTDDTFEICKRFLGKGVIKLEQYKSETFDWDQILRILYDLALTENPNWVIRCDSDEFLESYEKNKSLKEVIEQAESNGYNLIQFDWFDFYMTDNDNDSAKSVKEKFQYYTYVGDFNYRAWKYYPGIRMGDTAGHYPVFPKSIKYKISPTKCILRHYPLRSPEQAEQKMQERVRGRIPTKEDSGIDSHIKSVIKKDFSKKIDLTILAKYDVTRKWNYKKSISIYSGSHIPGKKNIFTEDGYLKNPPKTPLEYRLSFKEKEEQLRILRKKLGLGYRAKRAGLNKVKKILGKKESDI